MTKIVLNDLYDYGLKIYQDEDLFKFSLDSILLAEFVEIKNSSQNILDMCTGNCPIPLILSKYTDKKLVCFEIQKEIYSLGLDSIKYNHKAEQIKLINADIKDIGSYYQKHFFDIMICNPPFFKYEKSNYTNENPVLARARHEIDLSLDILFNIAANYLTFNGVLYLVHRANRLDEIIILANKYGLNVKKLQIIETKTLRQPNIILLKCVKNSNLGVIINPIINVENLKSYQNIFRKDKK